MDENIKIKQILKTIVNWEDNVGSLLALEARGCRFESYFSDKTLTSIKGSAAVKDCS